MLMAGSAAVPAIGTSTITTACLVYLVGYAGYCFSEALGDLRYAVYLVPPIIVSPLFLPHAARRTRWGLAYLSTYTFVALLGYAWSETNCEFFVSNFIIITLIIVCFVPAMEVRLGHIRAVFVFSAIFFFIGYLYAGNGSVRLLEILGSGTGSGLVDGYDNHQGGLVGPVYAVFFYAIGAKIPFITALGMSFLGGKRIGLIALFVGLIAAAFFKKLPALNEWRNRFIVVLGGLLAISVMATNLTDISEFAHERLSSGVHIEAIMLGRHAIGVELTRIIDSRAAMESLIGTGPGCADTVASIVSGDTLTLPHNDWLKLLYDYGIVGSFIIMMFMAFIFSSSKTGAIIALVNATIMVTDNVHMYLYYQFPIVLMVAFSARQAFNAPTTMIAARASLKAPPIEEGPSYPIGQQLRGPP
jgi:hypothetical protein